MNGAISAVGWALLPLFDALLPATAAAAAAAVSTAGTGLACVFVSNNKCSQRKR